MEEAGKRAELARKERKKSAMAGASVSVRAGGEEVGTERAQTMQNGGPASSTDPEMNACQGAAEGVRGIGGGGGDSLGCLADRQGRSVGCLRKWMQ